MYAVSDDEKSYGQAPSSTSPSQPTLQQRRTGGDPAAAAAAAVNPSFYPSSTPYAQPPAAYPTTYGHQSVPSYGYAASAAAGSGSSGSSGLQQQQQQHQAKQNQSKDKRTNGYAHNATILTVLLPCLWIILTSFDSPYPLQTFLFTALALYCLDLAGSREGIMYGIWIAVCTQTTVCSWFLLIDVDVDGDATGGRVLTLIVTMTGTCLFWICAASWTTLQLEWLVLYSASSASANHNDAQQSSEQYSSQLPVHLERTLHSILPPVAACLISNALTVGIEDSMGRDTAAIAAPFLFAVSLVAGMMWIGSCHTSFPVQNQQQQQQNQNQQQSHRHSNSTPSFVLSTPLAQGHVALLLATPAAMHVMTCLGRIVSSYASSDDFFDWIIVTVVPYLMLYATVVFWNSSSNNTNSTTNATTAGLSPYQAAAHHILPGAGMGNNTLRGTALPAILSIVTSWALQQRYLISICHSFAYHFMGAQSPAWLISAYWTVATVSLCFSLLVWGRQSGSTGALLFGEYHEDMVQLGLALSGLALGKAFGLPWNFTPLPILAFLGLSLWITSRMLRYLSIFLFVLHATGLVIFTYRFAGIDSTIALPLPGVEMGLARFGLVVVLASVLVGLATGLAVRPSGGFGAKTLRKIDMTGFVLIVYSLVLMVLEITLLKRPVPSNELIGMEVEADEIGDEEMLYDHALALLTSVVLIGIALFMKRVKILSARSSWVIISLALGKAISLYIDDAEADATTVNERATGWEVFFRAIIASLLCIVMFAPRAFLEPVHLKTATRRRRAMGTGESELPSGAVRTIIIYAFGFLPSALFVSIPYVLFPLVGAISGNYGGDNYYSATPPISELVGSAISLWGLSCLSMLNYYLPDGGGKVWKKLSALSFLMGIGIFFAAPTLGASVGEAGSNPYAAISSLGSDLISQGKSKTGGWGLLSATLATLLAMTGPLELKERKDSTGRKDSLLLFRTMVFSLMFGGGVAWFIIMQSMSETEAIYLVLTAVACMTLAFLGTVAAVLGYFLELETFDEVEQVAKMWIVAMPIFLPVTGIPQLFQPDTAHPFGAGGWFSTYLVVCGIAAISVALALRSRASKNSMSRGLGNTFCVISWGCAIAVLYGRYGVAGLDVDFDVTTFFGIPASIFGTFLVSPILLVLEGDKSEGRGRIKRISATTPKPTGGSIFRLNLPNLKRSNEFYPVLMGTTLVFLGASAYAILIRGSGLFSLFGASSIARSHSDLFTSVFGSTGSSEGEDDLAVLAKKTILHSQALTTSAKLAGSGFWTSDSLFGPLLHLGGIMAVLPTLYLLYQKRWQGQPIPASQITLALPLNAIPLLLCRGIPSLQAAALVAIASGLMQVLNLKNADRQSKMRI